jgi:hypothetical protein
MDSIGIAVTVLAVSLLWVAAVVFGRDSRDGRDWRLGSRAATGTGRSDRRTECLARRLARRSVR